MLNSGPDRLSFAGTASLQRWRGDRNICVFDRRSEGKEGADQRLETSGWDFNTFVRALHKKFAICPSETFVLVTTDRTIVNEDSFEALQDGTTLYLLQHENQILQAATEEYISFTPHHHTMTKSGPFEYYSSENKKPLPYALGELIDNALSATAKITGARTIELRLMFDESLGKPAVIILDNGRGMSSKQLNNWAVFRLSKFSRESGSPGSKEEGYVHPDPVPRSLNCDISYFGAGGKQAIFYIGESVRMISKTDGSPDVHELLLSKEEFERKEKSKEEVFSGFIKHRKPGDSSHISKESERFLHPIIAEESGKANFTAVVITKIQPEHISFLKNDFDVWTRQLAHMYHYYIHGVSGNDKKSSLDSSDCDPRIDIQITLQEKPPRRSQIISLKEIDDDMQTMYIKAAVDTFEFKAIEPKGGMVEGVIRYHPFLYDRETYPEDHCAALVPVDHDNTDGESGEQTQTQARGKRPIFECFWNGRLIPYTTVSEFEWCTPHKGDIPEECYSRFSGVLFTNDGFMVSTNKLTFMDLELKLKNKETIFTAVSSGSRSGKRSNIQKEFIEWLKSCHKMYDKQVKFLGFKERITRTDVPKKDQHSWATFSSIEWDGKIYKTGQLVKSQKTKPVLYGKVVRFLVHGADDKDVYATGGQVEICCEPKALYDTNKIISISKIDRTATDEAIKRYIDSDSTKLPHELRVNWSGSKPWPQNAVYPAGTALGPIKVEILNKKGESICKLPTGGAGVKMNVKLTIHGPKSDVEVVSFEAQYSASWSYYFKKIETLTKLGKYTLCLKAIITDGKAEFGGSPLPSFELKFTIKEGVAYKFTAGPVSLTQNVGVPFDIPLQIKDAYDHLTTAEVKPQLQCRDLKLTYDGLHNSGTTFILKGVRAKGKVLNYQQSKTYDLGLLLPGLKEDTQVIKIALLPGPPHSLHVTPEESPISVENGNAVEFNLQIHDESGNITANPKQTVCCMVPGFPDVVADCSTTGAGQLMTKPIILHIVNGEPHDLKAQFVMPHRKNVTLVLREIKVLPSTQVSLMEVYSQDNDNLVLKNNEKINWPAGGLLENLFYKLYDEAGRKVPVTAEIAAMIKVNWTAEVDSQDLMEGKLPDLQVPTQVHEERFYQVSYYDQSVSVSFTIVPCPDEPARLKATLPLNTVKLGEILFGNIVLELVDQYDNPTKSLTSSCVNQITIEAEGLDTSTVAFQWQESSNSIVVLGVRFQSGSVGPRELCFSYSEYSERVIVKVTAGVPTQLKLVNEPEQPLQVLNGRGIATPFVVQLCDEWGNPSTDQRVVVQLRSSPPLLKVTTPFTSQPVNAEGKASFKVTEVNGPKGYYQLEFKGSFNRKPITGPSVNLTVLPDPNNPVGLSVQFSENARFLAGSVFPVFSVTVVSEEGSPITTFNPANVTMYLWSGASSRKMPPHEATKLRCSKPLENEKIGCFYFRDKQVPEKVGTHTIQFCLRVNDTQVIFSDQINVNVVASEPVRLGPESMPPTPVVSYSKDIASRTLVKNMTLRIEDIHKNPAGQDFSGKVSISIMHCSKEKTPTVPLFEGKINCVQVGLVEGKAYINRLAIMENSPGDNGCTYKLLFRPEVENISASLANFELPFHFYNDVDNQRKMSELTKKKDELVAKINTYEESLTMSKELLDLLTSQLQSVNKTEAGLKRELDKRKLRIPSPVFPHNIEKLIQEKTTIAEKIRNSARRVCNIRDNFRGQADVLGIVGHLALVENDNDARVISWQLGRNMDCVVTKTKEAATRIYNDTAGRQQVLPLENVHVYPGNRPLPHIKNGRKMFDPTGNPVLARELLIHPHSPEECAIVFKTLLGNTIVIDDLSSANTYRNSVVNTVKSDCPTILTRQGERVSSQGMFGGSHNKAPPMNSLTVFGKPLPEDYHIIMEQRELLLQYSEASKKRENAENELASHYSIMRSPETEEKKQEMEELKRQLQEIEKQLASASQRPVNQKRGPNDPGGQSGILNKRPRQT
ncbi:structural maintenance of chromosomes flexible hinge domain-containing protein 1 isoform 1-T1 [Pholidichthys leucotaenia]